MDRMRAEHTSAFEGSRLRLARQLRGLTLRGLAEDAQITPGALSQMEAERIRPTQATAARLALALQLPPAFFDAGRRPVSGTGTAGVHFRSLRSSSQRERQMSWAWSEVVLDVTAALEHFVELPDTSIPGLPIDADGGLSPAAAAAAEVRRAWELPEGPVGNLLRNLEAHGIVTAWSGPAPKIDAYSHHQSQRPVVILGPERGADTARLRFSAAHELGHLVCHPEADPAGGHEHQANAFAAELLLPADLIAQELPSRFDLGRYARLKARWGVSIQALLYRARGLEIISDGAYRRAMITLGQTHGRTSEPFPLTTTEAPKLLSSAYQLAVRHGTTMHDLEELSRLPAPTIRQVVEPPATRPVVEL
jgi:Zn-dependent peptidase ImmA (M78 family)/transcriptional regulator with XRE-family HTH domain